jgi:hypothetical protein
MEIEPEEQRLKDAFDYIKSTYFKSWNKHGEWIIELIPNLALEKVIVPCSKIEKSPKSAKFQTITLHSIPKSQKELYSLIIHLIAHAISENSHEMPWLVNMLNALKIAKRMKEPELVELIAKDIQPYQAIVERDVYKSIIEFLFEHPYSNYDSILKKVSIKFKSSPTVISKQFKSCKTMYIAGKTGAKMRNRKK